MPLTVAVLAAALLASVGVSAQQHASFADALRLMLEAGRLSDTVEDEHTLLIANAQTGAELKPRLLRDVKPHYTPAAMKEHIEGTVSLACLVRADGTVGDVRVLHSLDPYFGQDEAAVKAARQWRFLPGMRDGVAVEMWVTIDMAFTLHWKRQRNGTVR